MSHNPENPTHMYSGDDFMPKLPKWKPLKKKEKEEMTDQTQPPAQPVLPVQPMQPAQPVYPAYPYDPNALARRHAADSEIELRKKSMVAAYVLWGFFGFIGGHRFYMKNNWMGFFMLITFGGAMVWTFIDAFFLAGRVNRYNAQLRYEVYSRHQVL